VNEKDPAALPGEGERPPSFEQALVRLETLVERLEKGDLPLEETIEVFEEGQKLLRVCNDLLGRAELRVKEILRRADGELIEVEHREDEE
jgi:exodeoxyribonuclease VII small subunit